MYTMPVDPVDRAAVSRRVTASSPKPLVWVGLG